MRISIAMCTYNGARHLAEQLQSFEAQERMPDELVVCDDGSRDQTLAILEQFAVKAPFAVRVVRNPVNLGYSRNFAQAVGMCSGDAIALSDQDDRWHPRKLLVQERLLQENPRAEGVFSDGEIMDEASAPTGRTLWESFRFGKKAQARFGRPGGAVEELLRRNVVTGMTLAVRRSAAGLLREAPASWIHDGWVAFLIALRAGAGTGLMACPERLVSYRVHGKQQIGTPPTGAAKLEAARAQGVRGYGETLRLKNLEEYQRTARQFGDLAAYLEREELGSQAVRAAVRAKEQFASRGAEALGRGRLARMGPLVAEMSAYWRFSPNGLRGWVRDLLI